MTKPKCINAIDEIGKRKEAKIIQRVKKYMNLVVSNCLDTFISGYLEDPTKKKDKERSDQRLRQVLSSKKFDFSTVKTVE